MKSFTKILLAVWLFFGPIYAVAQQIDTLEILHDTKGKFLLSASNLNPIIKKL